MCSRIKNKELFNEISAAVDDFSNRITTLRGIKISKNKDVLVKQLIDSIRRIRYLELTSIRARSPKLYTPYSGSFEPFGGAAALHKTGRIDDAYWMVYLATYFGKNKTDKWNLTEDIYGQFGEGEIWDWHTVSSNPSAIEDWLIAVYPEVTKSGRSRKFGNHRKFETLKPGTRGAGHALKTYVEWVLSFGSHSKMIVDIQNKVGQNPTDVYAELFKELNKVSRFGRLGKFDFLCNLSNLQLAPIIPNKAYIVGSTGPTQGAELLFGEDRSVHELDTMCVKLATNLNVSPQVIEDALCNWQKNPGRYQYFRG